MMSHKETEQNEPSSTNHSQEQDSDSFDPNRFTIRRMPTEFLKWVIRTPLPREDKKDLWLNTLPPGHEPSTNSPHKRPISLGIVVFAMLLPIGVALLIGYGPWSSGDEAGSGSPAATTPASETRSSEEPIEEEAKETSQENTEALKPDPQHVIAPEKPTSVKPQAQPASEPQVAKQPNVREDAPNKKAATPRTPSQKSQGIAPVFGSK